jgi:hypothetical protein
MVGASVRSRETRGPVKYEYVSRVTASRPEWRMPTGSTPTTIGGRRQSMPATPGGAPVRLIYNL